MAGNGLDAGCNNTSEASSFSAPLERNDHNDGAEYQRNTEKTRDKDNNDVKSEHDQKASNNNNNSSQMLEFVKLSSDDSVCGSSKVELDFFRSDKAATRVNSNHEGIDENNAEEKESSEVTKTFSCSFCKREFSSSQALGGHQNAHKQERAIAKRRQEIDAGAFGYPYFPGLSSTHASFYGSYNNRALGVRMESMIHKPSYPWTPLRYGHGPPGWSRPGILQNHPRLDRLSLEGLQEHGGGGVGILGSASSSALKIEDENLHSAIGQQTIPHFGGGSSSADNIASSSNSAINKTTLACTEDHHPNKQEEPSSSILDLSLRL